MTKTRLLLFVCLAFLIVVPFGVKAYITEAGNSVYIPKDRVVDSNLFTAGSIVNIDGTVKGDVICAGQTININGKVEGDVICAGQTININGEVGGSVRVAGNSVNINGPVARNVYMAGATLVFGGNTKVGWDVIMAGASADIRGKVGGDLLGAAGNVFIAGEIGKNIRLQVDNRMQAEKGAEFKFAQTEPLTIAKEAVINGNVNYTSNIDAKIDPGAKIKGKVEKKAFPKVDRKVKPSVIGMGAIISLFGALVVGLLLVSVWGKSVKEITDLMLEKPGPAFGWGAVILFLGPIGVFMLFVTLIGIPLALIAFGIWLIAIYLSKIMVAVLVGRSLLEKLWNKKADSLIWAMIIGVIVVWIVCWIPVIGWLLGLAALLWGLGGMWQYVKHLHK